MRKFVKPTGSTGRRPRSLRVGMFTTALTIVSIVALAATPREELATRGLDFTAYVFADRAGAGDMDAVKLFLAAGMDVNAVNLGYMLGRGVARENALLAASSRGDVEIVSFLVEKGADVNKRDHADQTPLMAAAIAGHTEIVANLAASGADVNAKGAYGQTPLIFAATSGSVESARILLGWGAMVNARDDMTGETALDRVNHPGLIPLLRAAGGKKASELQ